MSTFHTCGSCRVEWPTWDGFVRDPAVRLLGLQSLGAVPDANLLVFEHVCGSSISILSRRLRYLLPEPEPAGPATRLLGTEECRGHCAVLGDMQTCDAPCANARDRRLLLFLQNIKNDLRAPSAPQR